MKMKTRTITGRVLSIIALLLLLTLTLTGCFGGGRKTEPTLTPGDILMQTEQGTDGEGNPTQIVKNGLTSDQLKLIAGMLASTYSTEFDTHAMLVAANRGYDMTAEGFDDNNLPTAQPENKVQFAKNVIAKANEKAESDQKIGWADYEASFNEYDLTSLVKCFQAEVNLSTEGGFARVLQWIGIALGWMTDVLCFDSYFLGICLFAIVIEILMLPFAIKQQKNSIRQAALRPKEMAIRNKYKGRNDQATMQKMQQEIQEFYQRENYSPFSGCLPMLIQLPIVIVLYQIIIDPLHYVLGQSSQIATAFTTYCTTARAAGGLGMTMGGNGSSIVLLSKVKDLGIGAIEGMKDFAFFSNSGDLYNAFVNIWNEIPDFTIGKINLGMNPSFDNFNILLLVPVLTFATYFLTSKLNRKFMYQPAVNEGADARQTACSNNMMDITMPAMSTVFTFMVPALIGVYWIFRSLVSLLKQFIISRVMPLPTFTEEDYKAAAREMAGKKTVQKSERAGKVRYLHYIDDEDFEDTRERGLARRAALEEQEREAQEKKAAQQTPFGASPLKKDRKKSKAEPKDEAPTAADKPDETAADNDNQNNDQE